MQYYAVDIGKFLQPFRKIMLPPSVMWILRNTVKMEAGNSSETSCNYLSIDMVLCLKRLGLVLMDICLG